MGKARSGYVAPCTACVIENRSVRDPGCNRGRRCSDAAGTEAVQEFAVIAMTMESAKKEILTEVQPAGFQGRGSASLLQMCPEHFGGCSVVEALSRLVVEMASKLDELALRHACKVGIAWHVSTDALVDVFHGTFLPRRAGVTKPAPRADAIFQSPEAGKLRAAIKGETLPGKGWQGRERFDDVVHDRPRVAALVLDHDGVAALALDQ